jgi:hypothetical protein
MGKVEFGILNPMVSNYALSLENVGGIATFTSHNNGSLPIQFKGELKNFKNNTYENVLTSSDITTISGQVNTNTNNITTLSGRIDTNTTNITTNTTNINGLTNSLLNYA